MSFETRSAAGRTLISNLMKFRDHNPVILALPRGGVAVAAEIATALDAPLDLVLVRKIGMPSQPELAMGAVVDGGSPIIVRNEEIIRRAGVSDLEFNARCEAELATIDHRRTAYLGNRDRVAVKGRVAIIVDDGIATGATIRAALRATRMRKPASLILAVPVSTKAAIDALRPEADEIICTEIHEGLSAIGFYYTDFHQMTDEEVISLLARFPVTRPDKSARI
jgi:putative phosphoribosyl transferase